MLMEMFSFDPYHPKKVIVYFTSVLSGKMAKNSRLMNKGGVTTSVG